jgi:hypothetical protein
MNFGPLSHLALYEDRSLGGRPYPGVQPYYSDSEPDSCFGQQSSSLSLPSSRVAPRLQNPLVKCDRNLGWNIEWAVAFIVDHLEKRPDAAETLRSIRIKAATLEKDGLTKDVPYRIFHRLDETLFAGHLKNAVFLETSSLAPDVSGATYTHSWGPFTEVKRISIILNSDVLEYAKARDVVAILIHHMIHAYFLVACGPQKEEEIDYGRLGHDVHFGKVMSVIKKLSAVHGKELTPLNFGHGLGDSQYYTDGYYYPRRRPSKDGREDQKDRWYCSHCHSDVHELSLCDIEKWYEKVCKPMLEQQKLVRGADVQVYNERRHELEKRPRGRLASSAKSVEFLFKDKAVLVESKKLETLLGVRRAFDMAKSRFCKVDKEVDEKTFMRFLEFVHVGKYVPDPRAIAAAAASLGLVRKGPPIIKGVGSAGEAYLLADVQFAKMASIMKFDECKSYALGRMNSYGILTEDPVAVLQEIYSNWEPDVKLKEWARRFLVATSTPAPSSDYLAPSVSLSRNSEPPNLFKLESEQGPWRVRLHEAMENSGALENDVRKAWLEIRNAGWMMGADTSPSSALALLPSNALSNLRFPSYQNLLALGGLTNSLSLAQQQQQQQLLLGNTSLTPSTLSNLLGSGLQGLSNNLTWPPFQNLSNNSHSNSYSNSSNLSSLGIEREHIRKLEQQKRRELERERDNLRKLEKKTDRVKEEQGRVQAATWLDSLYGRSMGGVG